MAGKKYPDELKERVRTALAVNDNLLEASRKFGIPKSTIQTWKEKWENEENEDNLGNLRTIRRKEFIEKSWNLMEKVLEKAGQGVGNIDVTEMTSSDINALSNAVNRLYQVFAQARDEDKEDNNDLNVQFTFVDASKKETDNG